MNCHTSVLLLLLMANTSAFCPLHAPLVGRNAVTVSSSVADDDLDEGMAAAIRRELNYKPGEANTDFARRYRHLVGERVKTVGEAFAAFTRELQYTVSPLYKNMVTDLVGTTHLVVVSARFQRDNVWSLGMLTALDLLLKNYPEPNMGDKIISSMFKSVGLNEAQVRAEARELEQWAQGKSRADVEAALAGQGDGPVAKVAKTIQNDKFWMYSRFFAVGLIRVMELVGIEMDKDEVYPVMENWMGEKLGRSSLSACNDSDLFFKIREKLDIMETMMKEIEIREKKRMAERLEEKAEEALRAVEKEEKMEKEIADEAARNRERVQS